MAEDDEPPPLVEKRRIFAYLRGAICTSFWRAKRAVRGICRDVVVTMDAAEVIMVGDED